VLLLLSLPDELLLLLSLPDELLLLSLPDELLLLSLPDELLLLSLEELLSSAIFWYLKLTSMADTVTIFATVSGSYFKAPPPDLSRILKIFLSCKIKGPKLTAMVSSPNNDYLPCQ
jgi:hypothetical protein